MLVRDSFTYLTARALPAVFSLGAVAVLTRALSPSAYGQYALLSSAAGLLYALLFIWITQAAFRFYSASGPDLRKLLTTALLGIAISSAVGVAAGAIIIQFLDIPDAGSFFVACAVLTFSMAWSEFTSSNLNLERRPAAYALLQMGKAVMNLCVGGGAAYLTGSPVVVVLSVAVSHLLLTSLPIFSRWLRTVRWRAWDGPMLRNFLRYGVPISMSFGLLLLLGFIERVILSHLLDNTAVAEFAVAYDLSQFTIGALAGALSLAFYPTLLSALEEGGPDVMRPRLNRYSGFLIATLLPSAAGLALVAPGLCQFIVGPDIRDGAIEAMPWMCGATLFAGLRAYYTEFSFQLQKWTIGGPITGLIMIALNIPLNLIVIPRYGVVGAAQVSFITLLSGLAVSAALGRKWGFPLPFPIRDFLKIVFATLIMVLAVLPLRDHATLGGTLLQIGVGAAVYLAAVLILNPIGIRDSIRTWQKNRPVPR